MVCSCCGTEGKNRSGCSCRGGRSHACLNNRTRRELREIAPRNQLPQNADIWSIAAINADASNRREPVNTPARLGVEMAYFVSRSPTGLRDPAILCISELQPVEGIRKFFEELNPNQNWPRYDKVVEKLNATERMAICWDTNRWTNIMVRCGVNRSSECVVSERGRYMVVCLEERANGRPEKLLLFSVHLPHKRGRQEARRLLLQAVTDLERLNQPQAVAIVGDFNINFEEEQHPDFQMILLLRDFFYRETAAKHQRKNRIHNNLVTPDNWIFFVLESCKECHKHSYVIVAKLLSEAFDI